MKCLRVDGNALQLADVALDDRSVQFQVVSKMWTEVTSTTTLPIQWVGFQSVMNGKLITVDDNGSMQCQHDPMAALPHKCAFRVLDNFLLARATREYVTVANGLVRGKGLDKARIEFVEQESMECADSVAIEVTSTFSGELDEDAVTKKATRENNYTTRFKRTDWLVDCLLIDPVLAVTKGIAPLTSWGEAFISVSRDVNTIDRKDEDHSPVTFVINGEKQKPLRFDKCVNT